MKFPRASILKSRAGGRTAQRVFCAGRRAQREWEILAGAGGIVTGGEERSTPGQRARCSNRPTDCTFRSSIIGAADRAPGLYHQPDLQLGRNDPSIRQPVGRPLSGHQDMVNSLAFSPDGKTLISSSRDGTILRWNVDPEAWIQRACRIAGRALSADEWRTFAGVSIAYSPAYPAP